MSVYSSNPPILGPPAAAPVPLVDRDAVVTSDGGLVGESFPLFTARAANGPLATQRIYGMGVGLVAGDLVTNILVCLCQAGVGAPPTTIRLGLLGRSGTVLAVTGNVAADPQWTGALGVISFPLSSPYLILGTRMHYLAIVANGVFAGTVVQLAAGFSTAAGLGQIGSSPRRCFSQSSVTDLPAVSGLVTPADGAQALWIGCN